MFDFTSATAKGVKSATHATSAALKFYAHTMEVPSHELFKKHHDETKHLVELGGTADAVCMTTFEPPKLQKDTRESRDSYTPVRKVHRCANPAQCVVCRNKFRNLWKDADSNKAQEGDIAVDQTNFETWVHIVQPEAASHAAAVHKANDIERKSDGWDRVTFRGASEPLPTHEILPTNALDNASLARDSLEELDPVPNLTRQNRDRSEVSFFDPLTPREAHSPQAPAINFVKPDVQDAFETVSLGTKPPTKFIAEDTRGLDNASLHRDMRQLRSAYAASINHNPTTSTTSTQPSTSTNKSLHAQFFSALNTTLFPSSHRAVTTASTAVDPLLRRGVPPNGSYTTPQTILSPTNCQSLHTCSAIFPTDPLPCRFTHDSYMSNLLDNSPAWMESIGGERRGDFCAMSVVRNAQHAMDEAEGVLELREWKQEKKIRRKFGCDAQEEEDRARDRHRLRKARGLEPEPVMGQEVFGRMF